MATEQRTIAMGITETLSKADFYRQFEGQQVEWENGAVITIMNNEQHQFLQVFLTTLLNLVLGMTKSGRVYSAGYQMDLGGDRPARQPDLLIVLPDHYDRLQASFLNGAADIAIEIISPESRTRDTITKFEEYEAAGVGEYWLIDPIRKTADIYHRGEDGVYQRLPVDEGGRLQSRLLPHFRLNADILWGAELPKGDDLIQLVRDMVTT